MKERQNTFPRRIKLFIIANAAVWGMGSNNFYSINDLHEKLIPVVKNEINVSVDNLKH